MNNIRKYQWFQEVSILALDDVIKILLTTHKYNFLFISNILYSQIVCVCTYFCFIFIILK